MAAIEVGRLCVKIAGRDAGKECLIVDATDKNFVLIDGNTRRRKCNIDHLELLPHKAELKKGAAHEDVLIALKTLGIKPEAKSPAKPKKPKQTAGEAPKAEKPKAIKKAKK